MGISFPYRIGVKGGFVVSKANIDDFTHIDESIEQILRTRQYERTMEHYFYSEIDTALFEPNDESLQSLIEYQVKDALERREKRIEVIDVTCTSSGGKVFVDIEYTVPEFNNNDHTLRVEVG